jgi:hypothetical protein
VLLHRGEAHRVDVGESRHRRLASYTAAKNVAARRVGQCVKQVVDLLVSRETYNHAVVGYGSHRPYATGSHARCSQSRAACLAGSHPGAFPGEGGAGVAAADRRENEVPFCFGGRPGHARDLGEDLFLRLRKDYRGCSGRIRTRSRRSGHGPRRENLLTARLAG